MKGALTQSKKGEETLSSLQGGKRKSTACNILGTGKKYKMVEARERIKRKKEGTLIATRSVHSHSLMSLAKQKHVKLGCYTASDRARVQIQTHNLELARTYRKKRGSAGKVSDTASNGLRDEKRGRGSPGAEAPGGRRLGKKGGGGTRHTGKIKENDANV